jgi:transposase
MQINKPDQNDADGLARIMRIGWYRPVHVKSFDSYRPGPYSARASKLVGMTTRFTNHIRSVLKTSGFIAELDAWRSV